MSKKENRIFRNPEGMPLEDRALKEAAGLFGEELMPLMDGTLSQEDRIRKSFQLLRGERENRGREELARMEAVLYTFAMKFLKKSQLKRLKEAMNMTILGEMIMQEGIEKGREEGREEGKEYINRLNMILIRKNRFEDVKRASQDREYQQKLIRELFPEEKR